MIDIKEILKKNPIVAAPLAGISNEAYRSLCLQFGAGLVYTEMVSAEALHYRNERTFEMTKIGKEEHPLAMQIFGSRIESMVEAAEFLDQYSDCDIIDINMGCPAPKVTKTGAGSALMCQPELAYEIVSAIVKRVKKPVSVKIRLGYHDNDKNYLSFAKAMEKAGASLLAVHGRTRSQMYRGKADWQAIKEIKEALHIPVIGNGDITTVEEFLRCKEESKVDAIMIGRGLMGNPFLIREIHSVLNGGSLESIPIEERCDACKEHARRLISLKGESLAMREMRGLAANYLKGLPHSSVIRGSFTKLLTYQELVSILDDYQQMMKDYKEREDKTC